MSEPQDKKIHLLYKKLGKTPFQCVDDFKKENPDYRYIPMTYAGRLDPMAEGLLLVLSGDEVVNKENYLGLSKEYDFQILWEFETDTADILGIPKKDEASIFPTVDEIKNILEKSVGKFSQKYPAFSSQTVEGKPLIQWAREGRIKEIELPSHEVEITKIEYKGRQFIEGKELLKIILERVGLVRGDFRQELISEKWKKLLSEKLDKMFTIDSVSISVSGGFYVRQFISDVAKKINTLATTFHIKRNKIGDFSL